ncbi:hypothetical protein I5L51_18010 [Pseudomonas mendocina]|nr:hypothetical protein [Pseudomonas mendocina]MBH3341010.1 hypothetical protein [Pseudomonas mendocina]
MSDFLRMVDLVGQELSDHANTLEELAHMLKSSGTEDQAATALTLVGAIRQAAQDLCAGVAAEVESITESQEVRHA